MPDVSIVIKATDQYSDAIKTMQGSSQHFAKDLDGMQAKLDALNKTRSTLKVDVDKAKASLREAEKQFAATGDASDALELQSRRLTFEEARRNLALVSKEAASTERQMQQMGDAISKTENRAARSANSTSSSGTESFDSIVMAISAQGIGDMAGSLAQSVATAYAGSAYGSDVGAVFSSALSSAVSGAAIGTAIAPGVGTALGAAAGGLIGAASGALQVEENKDDSFKSYVQENVENQLSAQGESLTSGSALAAQRETDLRGLTSLLGGDAQAAQAYQQAMIEVGRTPPFSYDTAISLSRDMLGLGLSTEETQKRINSLANTAAALGLSDSSVSSIVSYLESSQLSGQMESRVVKSLSKMGINVYDALAEAFGIGRDEVAAQLSSMDVDQAVQAIYDYMDTAFPQAADSLVDSFSGLSGIVDSYQEDLDNAMGEGYNETRKAGLAAQQDWLSGDSGESLQNAYRMMGQWQASLENTKEQLERDALNSVMNGAVADSFLDSEQKKRLEELGQEYQDALAGYNEGNEEAGAEMGRILAEAKIIALNEYNANEGALLARDSELALIESVRNDSALNESYYNAGYEKGIQYSKGRAAAMAEYAEAEWREGYGAGFEQSALDEEYWINFNGGTLDLFYEDHPDYTPPSYAVGLDYVPYDNFPALLHQGERVLTAEEARSEPRGGGIEIHIDTLAVREEADVSRVASELLAQIELASMRG